MLVRSVPAFAALAIAALVIVDSGTRASALTAEEKAETCKIGADHQKLAGAKRKKFLAQCMSDADAKPEKGK